MTDDAGLKDRLLMAFFPEWMQDAILAAVEPGHVTTVQAATAGLLVIDRVIAAVTAPGQERARAGALDFPVLVPDPADRAGVVSAYESLLGKPDLTPGPASRPPA